MNAHDALLADRDRLRAALAALVDWCAGGDIPLDLERNASAALAQSEKGE